MTDDYQLNTREMQIKWDWAFYDFDLLFSLAMHGQSSVMNGCPKALNNSVKQFHREPLR